MKRLVLGLFALPALGWSLSGTATAAPKGTLTIGIPTDVNTLDPTGQIKRVNVDFPTWMIQRLDREAQKRGVTRQALIKMWLADRPGDQTTVGCVRGCAIDLADTNSRYRL